MKDVRLKAGSERRGERERERGGRREREKNKLIFF